MDRTPTLAQKFVAELLGTAFLTWIATFKYTKRKVIEETKQLETRTLYEKIDAYDKIIESQNTLIKKQVDKIDNLLMKIEKLEEKIVSLEKHIKHE